MALKKTVQTAQGFDAVGAYHKVGSLSINGKSSLSFQVTSHKADGLPPFANELYLCAYDINGVNPIAQAYAHLKTLPAFVGAEDC